MKHLILLKLCILSGGFFFLAMAQPERVLHLSSLDRKPPVRKFPFSNVIVIDSRYDTSRIYSSITTDYQNGYKTFDVSASVAVKNYIDGITGPVKKGNATILINIRAMGTPNRDEILIRNSGLIINPGYNYRKKLSLTADAWYLTDSGRYKKILTAIILQGRYLDHWEETLADLVDDLIRQVSRFDIDAAYQSQKHKDKHGFDNVEWSKDTTTTTLTQIDQSPQQRWSKYPIMIDTSTRNGIFGYYDDLCQANAKPQAFDLVYDAKDSVYQLKKGGYAQSFAIRKDGELFIKIYDNFYVKLVKENGLLQFRIPQNLPDMYALLCLETIQNQPTRKVSAVKGNIISELAADAVLSSMQQRQMNKATNEVTQNGLSNTNRYCIVDLDNGDFHFSDKPF